MQIDFPLDIDIFESTRQVETALSARLHEASGAYILLSGSNESAAYAERLLKKIEKKPAGQITLDTNSVSDVYTSERNLRRVAPTLLVAVGGGKVGDFGKRLAYVANIPLLLVPTIIANDGLISPIAVLQDEGHSLSLPGRMPDTVLIDMQIISAAPASYLRSAACDLITNLSATNDWERATAGEIGRVHHLALQMSRMAAHMVLNSSDWHRESPAFLKAIIYGQMLSGIAMALAGSSRPCSGSEHLIAHALDAKSLGMNTLHGEKVGIISRFCLHLQKITDSRMDKFFEVFGISRVFPGCESLQEAEMVDIFSLARKMRPGRETILDVFSDIDLARRYADYISLNERRS